MADVTLHCGEFITDNNVSAHLLYTHFSEFITVTDTHYIVVSLQLMYST